MSIQQKTYRFRMAPTPDQEIVLRRFAGARRWIWNWALARKKSYYQATGRNLSFTALCKELTLLKQIPENAWLLEIDSQLLQQALRDLAHAFEHFFARRADYPRFKSKKRDESRFRIPQRIVIVDDHIIVPKIGAIKFRLHRPVKGLTKSATFKQDASGRWFVSLVVIFELPDAPVPTCDPAATIGVDLGLIEFAVLSTGERVRAPKYYRTTEKKLKRKQRALSRKQRGSRNRTKAQQEIAYLYRKIIDKRTDFLHKLSTKLIRDYQTICIEDLSVRGLARTKLSKSVYDAGWGAFRRMLNYKTAWQQKHLVIISRWYPSSRICYHCGTLKNNLTRAERVWICLCGAVHDRDLNAALNIRREGLRLLAVGHTES